jgi:hypothetical protein
VEDYPQLPVMPTASGTIAGASFAAAVAQVAIAAGRDDTLPTLTGIRIYRGLGEHDYRRLTFGLILATGVLLVIRSIRQLF